MTVRKAVIPAAGLGTRFLPATKAQPKEMLPVVDRPGIQYVVEEAVRAGVDDILIVTSRGKGSIEDHFDRSPDLVRRLLDAGKEPEAREIEAISRLARVHYVRQDEPLGLGHAVLMARDHVGGDPFIVMLPDEIVPEPRADDTPVLSRLIEIHERYGGSVLAVHEIPPERVSAYGVVAIEQRDGDTARVVDMVEKPSVQDAPSNLASPGRYLFTPDIFEAIESTGAGVGGEIQLTDAFRILARQGKVHAYIHEGPIYDVGKKLDLLRASIELALRREDLAKPLKEYLRELVGRLEP